MQSDATSVAEYLAELPPDRRETIEAVRAVILQNLPAGYEEGSQYGMIGYYVPHSVYPAGYHCDPKQPLPFAALAAQKNYYSLYMMGLYGMEAERERFGKEWAATGKKLDMGKSCIRFKKLDDIPLGVIGKAIRRLPVKKFIAFYESATAAQRDKKARPTAGKPRKKTSKSRRRSAK